jgi:hypothetical protein
MEIAHEDVNDRAESVVGEAVSIRVFRNEWGAGIGVRGWSIHH